METVQEWPEAARMLPPIVGAKEAAEILGISMGALKMRRQRGHFPKPVAVLACGQIWLRAEIEALVEA